MRDMRLAANKKRRETIWFSQRLADRCHASSYILLWVMEFTHRYRLSARFSMKIQLIGRHKNARPLSINRDVSSHFFAIFNLQAPFSSFRNGSQKLSASAYISARLSKAKQEAGHSAPHYTEHHFNRFFVSQMHSAGRICLCHQISNASLCSDSTKK